MANDIGLIDRGIWTVLHIVNVLQYVMFLNKNYQ